MNKWKKRGIAVLIGIAMGFVFSVVGWAEMGNIITVRGIDYEVINEVTMGTRTHQELCPVKGREFSHKHIYITIDK